MSVTLHQLYQSIKFSYLKYLNFNDILFLMFLINEFLIKVLFFINENIIDDINCINFIIRSLIKFIIIMFVKINCELKLRERRSNILLRILLNFTSSSLTTLLYHRFFFSSFKSIYNFTFNDYDFFIVASNSHHFFLIISFRDFRRCERGRFTIIWKELCNFYIFVFWISYICITNLQFIIKF